MADSLPFLVLLGGLGLMMHVFMKWDEFRRKNGGGSLFAYLAAFPAQTGMAVVGSIASFVIIHSLEWLNPGMAFACGYMGNSIAENLANKFASGAKK